MTNKKINVILGVVVLIIVGAFIFQKIQNGKMLEEKNNSDKKIEQKETPKTSDKTENKSVSDIRADDDYGDPNSDVVYYYGRECPHCKDVAKFLEENDIYGKVDFAKKEVWHNKNNGKELMEVAKKCGIDPNKLGVPFLVANGKCYIGGPDVEAFFTEKAGIK